MIKMMNRSRPLLSIMFEIKANMSTNAKIQNHYEILNVPQTSTQDDIKSAYYELTKKYHPDKNTTKEAKANFQKVSDAYEVLGNFAKRKQYDRDLMARGHRATVSSTPASAASYGIRRTVEVDPLAAFYKSRLGNTSETPIYNFDDWTRAHYGRTFKRTLEQKEAIKMKQQKRMEDFQEELEHEKSANKFIIITSIIFMCWLMIYHDYESKQYDKNRLIERQANEAKLQSKIN